MKNLLLAAFLSGSLVACTADSSKPAADESSTDQTADATEAMEGEAAPTTGSVVVGLSGEGLQFIVSNTGAARMMAMGESSVSDVETTLTRVLGEPSGRTYCEVRGLDTVSWANGLTITSESGNFDGWWYRASGEPTLTTMSGVGVGSTLGDAKESMEGEVHEASFGTLFVSGGLVALLDGEQDNAPITSLYAGVNCIAD